MNGGKIIIRIPNGSNSDSETSHVAGVVMLKRKYPPSYSCLFGPLVKLASQHKVVPGNSEEMRLSRADQSQFMNSHFSEVQREAHTFEVFLNFQLGKFFNFVLQQ